MQGSTASLLSETTEPKLLSVIFLFYVSLEKMNDQKSSRMQCNEDNQDEFERELFQNGYKQ